MMMRSIKSMSIKSISLLTLSAILPSPIEPFFLPPLTISQRQRNAATHPQSPTSVSSSSSNDSDEDLFLSLNHTTSQSSFLRSLESRSLSSLSPSSLSFTSPSHAIFRSVSHESPNEALSRFLKDSNPEILRAMSTVVTSLVGALSDPLMGTELVLRATGDKLANLSLRLLMMGYMFRNAEYVVALRQILAISSGTNMSEAFRQVDTDGSGFLDKREVEAVLEKVYQGQRVPEFEVQAFVDFFDTNRDGKISWEEFQRGLGGEKEHASAQFDLKGDMDEQEEEQSNLGGEPILSGTIQVELDDGNVIEVNAQEYIDDLKQQAMDLKTELAREMGRDPTQNGNDSAATQPYHVTHQKTNVEGSISAYIASLQGDVQSLTKGISAEVMEAMKLLIEFVLDGDPIRSQQGVDHHTEKKMDTRAMEFELPGSALKQLALWQLVMGYRLRETEATGEWRRLMD